MRAFLQEFQAAIEKEKANVFAIAGYSDGVLESIQITKTNPCQNVYSVAKAYVMTAVGFLVDRGLLSTDEYLTEILAEECPQTYEKIWDRVTVEMLLLHQVPLTLGFLDIDSHDATTFGEDYLAYVLQSPIQPEREAMDRCYTDAAYYLLSRIVEKKSGMSLDRFLWKYLLYPTGCREAAWSHCPMGHAMGATGLYIRAEDLAKLGAIYLQKGLWNGTRILSEEWVNTVLEKGYELRPHADGHAFGKGGMRGQMLLLIPEQNRVVAYQGCGNYSFVDQIVNGW